MDSLSLAFIRNGINALKTLEPNLYPFFFKFHSHCFPMARYVPLHFIFTVSFENFLLFHFDNSNLSGTVEKNPEKAMFNERKELRTRNFIGKK